MRFKVGDAMHQPIEKNKSLPIIPVEPSIFMKKADWEKWDAALRSGEYKQTKGILQDADGYCCLGVLQQCLTGETENRGTPSPSWLMENNIKFTGPKATEGSFYTFGDPFMHEEGHHVSALNDGGSGTLSMNFIQIADLIKRAVSFTDKE